MDFQFGEKEEKLRAEIRQFVKDNLPVNHIPAPFEEENSDETWAFAMHIAKKLAERKWLTMAWPVEHGGLGASVAERAVFGEEIGYWGIPGVGMGVSGTAWVGPTLMLLGTEEQKKKYLPLISSADPDGVWCTGYSEPNAGSDFANIRTRAEKRGDYYYVNGQKVWTSAAHRARWCWLACRTDPSVQKKHQGISLILVDMKSPGVVVRPIKTYIGFHYFNEVFFDDVKVPVENLVGQENHGWYHLMQALAFERGVALGASAASRRLLDELVLFCKETGALKKTEVRQKIADITVEVASLRNLALEAVWKMSQGATVIYEPSRDKAYNDQVWMALGRIGTDILGTYATLDPMQKKNKWAKVRGALEHLYWMAPGMTIAAGTTDTMRNIVGQFGLQLPRSY
jgi:3-oxocholest-4-en-26-oyl-CoA dehydrogenase alpha subunit